MAAVALDPEELIGACEHLLKTFDPTVSTVDAHASQHLGPTADGDHPRADPDKVFQKQVLYGCVRFKRALKVFLSSFFYNNAAKCARSDYTMYMVLGYLALFRLKELGWSEPVPFSQQLLC